MRGTRAVVAAALALAASVATVASAAQSAPGQAQEPPRWEHRLQQQLGLSEQQVQAIREVYQRDAATKRQHWQQVRQAQHELSRLALSGADPAAVQAKQDEVQRLNAQSIEMRTNTLRQIGPILTPDQREKLAQLMEHPGHGRHHRPTS